MSNDENNRNSFQPKGCKMKTKIVILIICSLIFDSIYEIKGYFNEINIIEEFITFVLFYILLERIIFNISFYSHHKVSVDIILILFIYYFILNIIQSKKYLSYIFNILINYSYSFSLLLIKYINTQYFINIYFLGTMRGICRTIQLIFQFRENIMKILYLDNIYFTLFYFILKLIYNFLLCKIISKLSPLHSELIEYITLFINFFIDKNEIIDYIILGSCFISSLIYLEILILNFCDLNKNIKENISERGDYELIFKTYSDIDSKEKNDYFDKNI